MKTSEGAGAVAVIVIREIRDVAPRPRHVPEVAAAAALARLAAEDPDPLRALRRIVRHAQTFLFRRGFR